MTGIGVNLPLPYGDLEHTLVEVNLPLNFESHDRGKFTPKTKCFQLGLTHYLELGVNLPPKTECFSVTGIGGKFTSILCVELNC